MYLVPSGWRDLDGIQAGGPVRYATARERGDGAPVMVAVRAGNRR